MINANDFKGMSDNDAIERAIINRGSDGVVVISERKSNTEPDRKYWLLDRAILLPADTTVILDNVTVKLSDKCRDNFFRSANCGLGITENEPLKNIHIIGEGNSMLLGADHPRSTGDGGKLLKNPCPHTIDDMVKYADWLPEERRSVDKITFDDVHDYSFGTDVGNEGESQYGDWRNIGILLASVSDFSIKNVTIKESHGWGISLEDCSYGAVEKICFDASMSKMVDGILQNIENEDGVDLRTGCHHITISDIMGETGDDVVALTAIATRKRVNAGGELRTSQVMHNDYTRRDADIHDIVIRNVHAYSSLCWMIRLLAKGCKIWNVLIEDIVDTAPADVESGLMIIGDLDASYPVQKARNTENITNITIRNAVYNGKREAIRIDEYLKDSTITNLSTTCKTHPLFAVQHDGAFINVELKDISVPENGIVIGDFWKYYTPKI